MPKFVENAIGGMKKKAPRVFNVRLISEGQGSSGFYGAEMLERDIAAAMPKGTHVYANHSKENKVRDIEDFVGVFTEDPIFNEEDKAAYVPVKFKGEVADFVEEFLDSVGVSIEIHKGIKSDDGIVEALQAHPLNSLALVTKAGARGKVVELMESFRASPEDENGGDPAENTKNRKNMDEKKFADMLAAANAPILEALTALKPEPVEDNKNEGPSLDVVAEAVATSGLTEAGRKAVYAEVARGGDYEEAIASEKAREDGMREAIKEEFKKDSKAGGFRVQEDATGDWSSKGRSLWSKGGDK